MLNPVSVSVSKISRERIALQVLSLNILLLPADVSSYALSQCSGNSHYAHRCSIISRFFGELIRHTSHIERLPWISGSQPGVSVSIRIIRMKAPINALVTVI